MPFTVPSLAPDSRPLNRRELRQLYLKGKIRHDDSIIEWSDQGHIIKECPYIELYESEQIPFRQKTYGYKSSRLESYHFSLKIVTGITLLIAFCMMLSTGPLSFIVIGLGLLTAISTIFSYRLFYRAGEIAEHILAKTETLERQRNSIEIEAWEVNVQKSSQLPPSKKTH